ncbi:hypothetical protein CC86DRAFT_379695 [Ophiobolus disseminans]|uniref:Stc1 domain-containing protein n=1 Tax=Ophiobolus disseminans TaxID=1469910 RepID=A0A6A7ABL1_9PLEO|nr:hypothetical protein CC86DRAFT_379695 [Ophiobolus disseminans]
MAKSRRQVHAYTQEEIEKLKSIALPEKVKCGRCNKSMGHARYSEKQLTDYRWQIKNGARPIKLPRCQKCAGGNQLVELECTMCHVTKGLGDFARTQRNVPDTAQCFQCTDIQVAHQPYSEERYADQTRPFVTADHSTDGVIPDYWSSSSSTHGTSTAGDWETINGDNDTNSEGGIALSHDFQHGMDLTGSVTDSLIGSEYSAFPVRGSGAGANGGGGTRVTGSWQTGSTGPASASTTRSASSGFNPNGYGRPSATSNAGTERSYRSSVAERSAAPEVRPNGWAKIRAYQAPTAPRRASPPAPVRQPIRPDGDAQREIEADTNAWDDASDEEGDADSDSDDSDGDNTVI